MLRFISVDFRLFRQTRFILGCSHTVTSVGHLRSSHPESSEKTNSTGKMSEFDAFASAAPTEEDPAAAFLAREQDQMAELEGEDFVAETTAPGAQPGDIEGEPEASLNSGRCAASDAQPDGEQDNIHNKDEILNTLEPHTDDLDPNTEAVDQKSEDDEQNAEICHEKNAESNDQKKVEATSAVDPIAMFDTQPVGNDELLDGFEAVPTSDPYAEFESGGQQDGYAAISSVDKQRQEPEKIRLWREEQKERLTTKDAEAEVKKGEWHEVAKRELEDWYKHREDQLEKSKKNNREANREAEAAFCQERDESLPGHEWERVTRLCEFNPKAARNTKDVSRMRSILLQLKQTPLVR